MSDYNDIYNYDIEDEIEESVVELKGTIGRGDCLYCKGKHTMKYEGNICFICSNCGKSIYEDLYYRWIAGYEVKTED